MSSHPRRVLVWRERLLPVSETFILNQVRALTGWEAVLAGTRRVRPSLDLPAGTTALYGCNSFSAAAKTGLWRLTGRSRTLDRHLETWRPRLIHAHFGPDATYVLPTAERNGLPLVATFHGVDATALAQRSRTSIYKRRLSRLFEGATVLHAVSDFIAGQLLGLGAPPEKVRRVYIGIPSNDGVEPGLPSRKSIVFVGRLVEKKGLGDLLGAVARLPGPMRDTKVDVIGDGPLAEQSRVEAVRLGLNVEFHGAQPSKQVATLMQQASVFCVPSKTAPDGDSEGLGMVFLEAGLHRLPTVSYHHGGVPEAITDGVTGLLAPEGDVSALAERLERMLSRPAEAKQFGEAARARVLDVFDISKQTLAIEELYESAADIPRTS